MIPSDSVDHNHCYCSLDFQSLLLVKSSIQNDEVGWIERSVRVAASMVSLWHVGVCKGILYHLQELELNMMIRDVVL